MFLIYPVLLGVLLGLILGGRPANLGRIPLRWSGAIAGGMLIQLALFVEPVTARVGELGPPIYLASSFLVLAAVVRNWRIPGLPILATGAAANLAAIVANGGYMPASPEAMAALGRPEIEVYSNSAMMHEPVLGPLTDIFAMPVWVPGANIFSIGDVLIGVGVAIAIVVGMSRKPVRLRAVGIPGVRFGRPLGVASVAGASARGSAEGAAGAEAGDAPSAVHASSAARPVVAIALPADEQRAVQDQLGGAGFEPIAVANAADLEALLGRRRDIAVAFLDGLGDLEACLEMYALLHEDGRHVPTLTVVAKRTMERLASAPASRFDDEYVTRPFTPEAARRQIEAMDLRRRIGIAHVPHQIAHDQALAV